MQKVALVTGASSRLGNLVINEFLSKGFIVYGASRKSTSGKHKSIKLDVTSDRDCKTAITKIIKEEGRLDVLVNVAGVTFTGEGVSFSSNDYLDILNTNAVGAFRLLREVVPHMKGQGGGKIINVTSLNGLVSLPGFALYSSSKHALEALGLAMSYELKANNIYVTNIAPGAIDFGSMKNEKKSTAHKPAREKFRILYYLLPMVKAHGIAKKVLEVAESKHPTNRIVMGRDARIMTTMQRVLPRRVWNSLMNYVWHKK